MLTIFQAFLLSLSLSLILSRSLGYASLMLRFTPMMMGLITGFVINDIPNALKISALVQLLYLGVLAPGGTMRSEPAVAVSFAITIVLYANIDFSLSLLIAFIFGLVGGKIYPYRIKINSKLIRLTEKYVEESNDKGLLKSIILFPILASLSFYIPVFFLAYYFMIPIFVFLFTFLSNTFIYNYLVVISAAFSLVGFALSMHVIGKSNQQVFFVASFIFTLIFNPFSGNILLYAFFGLIFSITFVLIKNKLGYKHE